MIYRPIYVDKIMTYVNAPFIKILTGIRRCGKSTILKMLIDEMKKKGIRENQILHYSFDSLEYEDIKTAKALFSHLKQHLSSEGKTYLFLDEIQEVKSWEKVVNSLMTDYDVDIYVTGSNSRMMSSEISTYLTGRYIAFRIYPFCNQSQAYRILGNIRLPVLSYQKSCVFQFEILVSYHCHTTIYLSYCLGAILSRASE